MLNIGIIGTGLLGRAIAARILGTGHRLIVYNRTAGKTKPLQKMGAEIGNSPKDIAEKSDVVIITVRDSQAVESVSFGKDGIVKGKHKNLLVADMSTISPIKSRRISKIYSQHRIPFIDSPVMGGPSLAEKGELVIMVGGRKKHFEKCKPLFKSIAQKSYYLGKNGTGHAMKLALNLQISLLALSISEGIILARKSGLDPANFLEILNSTHFKTGMSINKGPKMMKGNFEPSFYLKMMQKDLDEINYTAKEYGAFIPMANLANELYQSAIMEGMGELDYTSILAYLEKKNQK